MRESIEKLIAEELQKANTKFPPFASRHEGAAVIREGIDESEQELHGLMTHHGLFWHYIKVKGEPGEMHDLVKMRERAIRLAEEAIQVAAMCDKYMPLLEE